MAGVDQQRNAGAGPRDRLVHLLRMPVSPASLHVAAQQVVGHSVQYNSGRLRTGGVIKEDEIFLQSGKCSSNLIYGKLCHAPNNILSPFRVPCLQKPCGLPEFELLISSLPRYPDYLGDLARVNPLRLPFWYFLIWDRFV